MQHRKCLIVIRKLKYLSKNIFGIIIDLCALNVINTTIYVGSFVFRNPKIEINCNKCKIDTNSFNICKVTVPRVQAVPWKFTMKCLLLLKVIMLHMILLLVGKGIYILATCLSQTIQNVVDCGEEIKDFTFIQIEDITQSNVCLINYDKNNLSIP